MNALESKLLSFPSQPEPAELVTVDGIEVPRALLDEALGLADFHNTTYFVGRLWLNTGQLERSKWNPEALARHLAGVCEGRHGLNTAHEYLNAWIASPERALMVRLAGNWIMVPPERVRAELGYPYKRGELAAAPAAVRDYSERRAGAVLPGAVGVGEL